MTEQRKLKQKLAAIRRLWAAERYAEAFALTQQQLQKSPGNPVVLIAWASLAQLLDEHAPPLEDIQAALAEACELDDGSPLGHIELGNFLDAVQDDPTAAVKAFADGAERARRALSQALLGQARTLLQLKRRQEAIGCLLELLRLEQRIYGSSNGKSRNGHASRIRRGGTRTTLEFQLAPTNPELQDLLDEVLAAAGSEVKSP